MPKKKPAQNRNVVEFAKRVKSVLWRQDTGNKERPKYEGWKKKVEGLESKDGAGYTNNQAIVQASKDYPCLARLFREYDLSDFDPNPESHPTLKRFGETRKSTDGVVCEGKKQTYRETLQWAIDTAGAFIRTGIEPNTCPSDAAWYLYRQAIEEPKDFLAKIGQVETKFVGESEDDKNARKSGRKTIAEIDSMLATLKEEAEDEGHDDSL